MPLAPVAPIDLLAVLAVHAARAGVLQKLCNQPWSRQGGASCAKQGVRCYSVSGAAGCSK